MAASFCQIKNINAQSFFLSALTINRMLASLVFKKTKGTGFASNKALKTTPFGRSDAFTRGGFAIMPHANAPLSLMLAYTWIVMKIREIVEETLKDTGSGKSADICAKSILCNLIKDNEPFQAIELKSLDHLMLMMKESDFPHVYGEGGVFYFSAYYFHDERYPVGRNYFMQESDLLRIAKLHGCFKSNGLDLPIIPPNQLGKKIVQDSFEARIREFRDRQSQETEMFKGLFEGRSQSTTVEKSMFLNSPGCLVCGDNDFRMMSSTLSAAKGFMVGFNLCENHMEIAKSENSLLEYLAKLFKQPIPFQFVPLETKEHFELVLSWLPKELGCKVEKTDNSTMTLVRPSGLKGIFRLDSPGNYAYMIFGPNGKEVARIDSADHHNVNYGPDHLHVDLTKKKGPIESSFTTGSPLIDTKKILELIELKEAEFES